MFNLKQKQNLMWFKRKSFKWLLAGITLMMPLVGFANEESKVPAEAQSNLSQKVKILIKGKVIDTNGEPIPSVSIRIKGNKSGGAATNADGEFVLNTDFDNKNLTLVFSSIGYLTKEVKVRSVKDLKVVLEEDVNLINEVVVTGLYQRRKEGFSGSANKMSGNEIRQMTSGNVLKAIELLEPGFRLGNNLAMGANPSGLPEFNMRGKASIGDHSTNESVILRGDVDTRPNQPLFVLDGIIGVEVTKIIDLDPSLIESVTILKDAAAMVLYGSRASNGVIVIETKAPESGRLRVSYAGNYKLQIPDLRDYNLTNAREKISVEKRSGVYDDNSYHFLGEHKLGLLRERELEVLRGVDTYWLSEPLRTAFMHRHALSIEGGDSTLRYKIYAGMNSAPGVMKFTGIEGRNGSIDIRYRKGKFLLSNILFVDYTKADRTSKYGSFSQYARTNPYFRKYDKDGSIKKNLEEALSSYTSSIPNPMRDILTNTFDKNEKFDLRNALKLEYSPINNLRLSLDVSMHKGFSENNAFLPSIHSSFTKIVGLEVKDKGSYAWSRTLSSGYDIGFTASYNKTFKEKHLLSSFLYLNMKEDTYHTASVLQTGFPNQNMDEVFLGMFNAGVNGEESRLRSMGALATISYIYNQRYAVDANIRVDASSEFGRNNRLAPFWSVGARWNLDKETFINKNKWIDELVLRATYGITGTQGFTPYQAMQMYTYRALARTYDSSDVTGTEIFSIGNPNLKWQTTAASNLGLDFSLFRGIFSGKLEVYKKYTYNTILAMTLPPSVGFNTVPENLGNISNKGIEFTARVMPINIPAKRLSFNVVLTGSNNVNKIEKISNALKAKNEEQLKETGSAKPLPRYEEGYSQTAIWAVRSLGIDPQTGREVYLTRDNERTTFWSPVHMVQVGDEEPTLTGVLSFNLNWKNLTVSLASRYAFGGMMYNNTLADKVENADTRYNVDRRAYTDRWEKRGDEAKFKSLSTQGGQPTNASTRFLMKNNQLVFNVINAQYRFERQDHPFLKKLGLTSAAVGLYLEDILRFNTIKVERGTEYPLARQISMSLNLNF